MLSNLTNRIKSYNPIEELRALIVAMDMRKWTPYERSRWYTTTIICVTVFFLFADQNLLAPNLSAVADDFHMDEQEKDEKLGGYIAFGFFIVGGPAALIVGYFTDTINRCKLFGLVVFFGEGACIGTYWVKTFEELLACRVLTGISIGGAIPIIFSMLGDLYPGEARVYMSTLVGIAFSAGVAGGQLLAGLVGPAMGWRAPFLFVAVPALIMAGLIAFTVEEPRRGDQEKAVRAVKDVQRDSLTETTSPMARNSTVSQVENNGTSKSNTGEIIGMNDSKTKATPGYLAADINSDSSSSSSASSNATLDRAEETTPAVSKQGNVPNDSNSRNSDADKDVGVEYSETIDWDKLKTLFSTPTAVLSYCQGVPGCVPWGMIYTFLNDYFSDARGLSVQDATFALTMFGIGGLAGQFYGGSYGQRLYNRNPKYQCMLMGGSTILGILPMLYLLNTTNYEPAGFYIMAFIAGLLVSITGPNVRAVLQNVCAPEVRGTAFAVFALTDDLGKGLGPGLVYLFIQGFKGDRQAAYNVVVLFWLWCGALLLAMMFTYQRDEAKVQAQVAQSLELHSHVSHDVIAAAAAKSHFDASGDIESHDNACTEIELQERRNNGSSSSSDNPMLQST